MGPAGPLADRLCDLCSGGRGCRARKGWWIVRSKTHTYLVGAPAFMSCGCGGQSLGKAQRPVGYHWGPTRCTSLRGRALAQYFIVRFRPSGWGDFSFWLLCTINPNIGQLLAEIYHKSGILYYNHIRTKKTQRRDEMDARNSLARYLSNCDLALRRGQNKSREIRREISTCIILTTRPAIMR